MIDESSHIWKFLSIFLLILLVILSLVFVFFSFGNKTVTQHSRPVHEEFFGETEEQDEKIDYDEEIEDDESKDPNFTSLKELIELSSY